MSDVEDAILGALESSPEVDSLELCKELQSRFPELVRSHQDLHGFLLSLESSSLITLEKKEETVVRLTDEGQLYADEGSPEYKYAQLAAESPGLTVKDLSALAAERLPGLYTRPLPAIALIVSGSIARAKARKYVEVKGPAVNPGDLSHDAAQELLQQFASAPDSLPPKEIADLRKRGLIAPVTVKWFLLRKGLCYVASAALRRAKTVELTQDLVKSGEWRNVDFAPLNFESLGAPIDSGHEHPLLKVRYEFRQIFLAMGFEEMDTYRWVESSFWNFDSLFQGQQHPCRDMHDTFFLSAPEKAPPLADAEYLERVKTMHERGGDGSIGLRYEFQEDIARTNILRTHTTACSSRYLAGLAAEFKRTGELRPRKFFSIDRVFRNETLDPTHLAEFHQVEGFVIDRGLSIADLMSFVKDFYARIGLTELEFKPAYNPYTEPSMEIFAVHPQRGLMEIGNSGIFRPEMLGPMGIPPEWSVVAWGFSLERPAMIEYKMSEIRKLEGPQVSLKLIRELAIPRFSF